MNRRVILIILLVLLVVSGIFLTVYYLNYKDTNANNNDNKEIDIVSKTYSTIYEYGEELYTNKKYLDFPKNDLGIYVANVSLLTELGYDMKDVLDKGCSNDSIVIYFDLDNVLFKNENDIPIKIDLSCFSTNNQVSASPKQAIVGYQLYNYAKDLYEKKLFLNFEKDERGVYYLNIANLDEFGYDISYIKKNCNIENMKLYFDNDNILEMNNYALPVYYNFDC